MGDLRVRFGRLVAAHRKKSSLTQEQLADAADLSVDMIGTIEAGKTGARFPRIERLADALHVDPAQLFTTALPADAITSEARIALYARLAALNDREIVWVDRLLSAALKPKN